MIQEEILFRLLQASSALGAIALLITCMKMHQVRWWVTPPIYFLAFMLITTFLTTFFMRRFTFDVVVSTIAVLSFSATISAINHFTKPLPKNSREASNRRLLWVILPIIFALFTIWCFGSAYEGGISFFRRFEQKLNYAIQNQDDILVEIDSAKQDIKNLNRKYTKQDATSAAYREKLDKRLESVDSRLTDQSLRLHRLSTDKQKRLVSMNIQVIRIKQGFESTL